MNDKDHNDDLERALMSRAGEVFEAARERALDEGLSVLYSEDGVIYRLTKGQDPVPVEMVDGSKVPEHTEIASQS